MAKIRADRLLVDRGLAESGARAQALILAGLVFAGERRVAKAGEQLAADAALTVKGRDHPWVSRGGVKLEHALQHFGWTDLGGLTVLDIGASTGGFTDVALTRGAARVFAVDVGYGQLDQKLRTDPRVTVLEKTNARHLTRAQVPLPIGLIVCDASFIGLRTVLAAPLALAGADARVVALIKPQFEAGPAEAPKGVVRNEAVHARVCAEVAGWMVAQGWNVLGIEPSPITGPQGNREFLLAAERGR
ncbi:MAG: TlyA family RNA methyltransferase [Sphingomonadaceae bacterium]|nr:TlyA family RNA methyltransferase [Sphingomonadaceae bacterium]